MKTATSIDESHKLISLGIDTETADMCYINNRLEAFNSGCEGDLPVWSLSALISILPDSIEVYDQYDDAYIEHLKIEKDYGKWWAGYGDILGGVSPDLFAACIDLIEQLVEQGYIKTKKKDQ